MKKYLEYLNEGVGKNLHLEHIEDLVLNDGSAGVHAAIRFLHSLRDMLAGHSSKSTVNLTTKWDGAPAIFAGINPENKKFFVGTKGVFNKNAKLNYTAADIDANHPSDGLNKKLKIALEYLPELGIKGIIQGDMMFTASDLKKEKIDGETYITFQPNTIVYAVPINSGLAQQIQAAKLGIVWHTEYHGRVLEDMHASFNINIGYLKNSRNVWYRDASFVDLSGTATFTIDEMAQLDGLLSEIDKIADKIPERLLNQIATSETYKVQIKTYNNSKVREGQKITNTIAHTVGLMRWVEEKMNKGVLEAKKSDTKQKRLREKNEVIRFYTTNRMGLKAIFDLQNLMVDAKNMIVRKLEKMQQVTGSFIRTSDGFKAIAPEGFVCVDKLEGNAVKLVDRLVFSAANFNAAKSWK